MAALFYRIFSCTFSFLFFLLSQNLFADFQGSFDLSVHQRFFSSSRLGSSNGFDSWGTFEMSVVAAPMELDFGFEPLIGFSYVRQSTALYAVDANGLAITSGQGAPIVSDIDRFQLDLYSFSAGLRYSPWKAPFFPIVPYAEILPVLRWGTLRKVTEAEGQLRSLSGLELAMDFGTGLFLVVAEGRKPGSDLQDLWGLGSFGFILSTHYSWGGLLKSGFGGIASLGGARFGGGLRADW